MTDNLILYSAPNDTMGDTSPEDCDAYRAWALHALMLEFPGYSIEVDARPSEEPAWTNDEARRDEILEFCYRLWDRCPWDWDA